ncbi:hypothetical protein [Streptomyces sp. C1-2]|uniref:hypothetical protein n=1 Tax=Streptomyces sp. C1-2 TaxID=2720022 RepID=UPI0014328079|nr:hypothetical protein [Streptomyces sp. C1-2]NJP70057.1 hypothetical protein [Streptomyces sp. C1-2]
MAKPTHTASSTNRPRGYAYCAWHRGLSQSAVLVQIIEQGSGPGAGLYACATCRAQHHLTPVTDQ